MKEYKKGDLVLSVAGHDKGNYYIIKETEKEYVFLIDGKYKTIDRPKKKKVKHISFIADKGKEISENPDDAEYRRIIKNYKKNVLDY